MTSDDKVTYFGETDSRNKRIKFGIKAKDRTKHIYVIGKTGMGKSTLLENMAVQDIQSGEGMCFIDPHGKTAELLLNYVPENRVKDVLYFAPFDVEHPIAFNVMEDVGYDKRHLVVSGLMSTFKKIWVDAWSARMEYILSNTLLALLEYPGATLLGVNKMLSDKAYRTKVVNNITDPSVKSFWVDEFAKYTDKFAAEATPAIQNKIGQFTNNPLIRNIIGQPKSSFDLRKFMDERKIIIVNLSKGRVGETNANLLGAMLITKIYLAAMSRADVSESTMRTLPNFYLYVDEFQSFANESFADILSEARKYKLNLTMAHQYIEQMSEEVRAAVFGNVGTMIVFRVGSYDAEVLEKEFAPQFTAEDIVNLGMFQIYLRLMIEGMGSQPFSAKSLPPIPEPTVSLRDQAVESSRAQFGQLRAGVEEQVRVQTLGAAAATVVPAKPVVATPVSVTPVAPQAAQIPIKSPAQTPASTSVPIKPVSPAVSVPSQVSAQTPPRTSPQNMPSRRPDFRNDTRNNDRRPPMNRAVDRPRVAPPHDSDGGFQSFDALKGMVAPRPPLAAAAAPVSSQPRKDDRKGVTEESKNDLRQALAALAKAPPRKIESSQAAAQEPKPESKPEPKVENKTSAKEVPEDVLKKVLDM